MQNNFQQVAIQQVEFYLGARVVGTLSLAGATGIGETFFDNGIVSLAARRRFTRGDGDVFLNTVVNEINAGGVSTKLLDSYFRAGVVSTRNA